jgi:IS5 family transposase
MRTGSCTRPIGNRLLTLLQRLINRLISAIRFRVEQCVETLKRRYGFFRMRYIGIEKGHMEFYLNTMTFNLKKAALKLEIGSTPSKAREKGHNGAQGLVSRHNCNVV